MFSYESTHWPHWDFCPRAQNLILFMIKYTMKQRGVLQLALQLNFWVAEDTYNSMYLYAMNVKEQVAWIAKLQFIIYIVQHIVTLSKQLIFNYYATPL
jgi:hypothetical protein